MNSIARLLQRTFSGLAAISSGGLLFLLGILPAQYFDDLPTSQWNWSVPLAGFVSLLLGIGFGRLLLRVFPIRFDGLRRRVVIFVVSLTGVLAVAFWVAMLAGKGLPTVGGQESFWINSDTTFEHRLAGFTVSVMWWFGAFGLPLIRHVAPKRLLNRPLILLLRRFSTFSDRTVLGAVLKCCPTNSHAVFLVPEISRAGDWNPFRIGFAGMKLWRPFSRIPIDLRSKPVEWQDAVEDLARRAHRIVIDVSLPGPAIDEELQILSHTGALRKTLILRDEKRKATSVPAGDMLEGGTMQAGYTKSWPRAWPRLTLGLFVTPIAVLTLLYMLVIPLSPILARAQQQYIENCVAQQEYDFNTEMQCAKEWSAEFLQRNWQMIAAIAGVLAIWIYYVLFFRAALSKKSLEVLRAQLQAPLQEA